MRAFIAVILAGGALATANQSVACWSLAWEPEGPVAIQQHDATIYTRFTVSPLMGTVWFDELGFHDASGMGLSRDVVVGIQSAYETKTVTIPAGSSTKYHAGFRWADLDDWFYVHPGEEYWLFYEGQAGDEVRLASPCDLWLDRRFELLGFGYEQDPWAPPAFDVWPQTGVFVFGANAQYVPEPKQWLAMLVVLLVGGLWARHRVLRGLRAS